MKPLLLYLCLPAILFQAIFASSSLNESASLSSGKKSDGSKPKKATGTLIAEKSARPKKHRKARKHKDVLVKENRPKLLIDVLPKELVKLVISYFNDDTYPIIVSTYNWLFGKIREIAVDSARLYVLTESEGLKSLSHSFANIKEEEHCLLEFGNSQWFNYWGFNSSHDGQCVFFGYKYKALTNRGEQVKYGSKWLTQINVPEGGSFKHVTFSGESLNTGILSRDGQTLFSYNKGDDSPITCIYQVREEAEKDPVGFMKLVLNGKVLAISGKGNRVMMKRKWLLEIHDIGKDTSRLVCQINLAGRGFFGALNEDGSKAAFVTYDAEVQIVEVDKVVGDKIDQPAIVTVPELLGCIYRVVYSEEGKLYVHHGGGKVSLFDSSMKKFVLLEAPQEGQKVVGWAISPDTNYIAFIQNCSEKGKPFTHTTIVKRKLDKADVAYLFGYEADMSKAAKPEGKEHEQ